MVFVPSSHRSSSLQDMQYRVPPLTYTHRPLPVRVIAMPELFVDEYVGPDLVERFRKSSLMKKLGEYWGVKMGDMELCGKMLV